MMRFLTFFPGLEDMHIAKDVGMIPYLLWKNHGYDSGILTYNKGPYPRQNNDMRGIKIEFISPLVPRPLRAPLHRWLVLLEAAPWLARNARRVDVLQLYHMSNDSIILAWIYKHLNPRGVAYMKMDGTLNASPWLMKHLCFDLYTVESMDAWKRIRAQHPELDPMYVPNGVDRSRLPPAIPYREKDNLILHSGRLGDGLKASEIVLDSFFDIAGQYPDARLLLLGPMTGEFKKYCEKRIQEHRLEDRVLMPGYVSNLKALYNYYNRARIIFMPSRRESFCLSLLEAMSLGSVPLTSNLPIFEELARNTGETCPVDDREAFTEKLRYMLGHEEEMETRSSLARAVTARYDWMNIADFLDAILKERRNSL